MTIEFTTFVGKAPTLEAIKVTEENIEDLAVWMGADVYSVEKTLVGGERIVCFKKYDPRTGTGNSRRSAQYARLIVDVRVGDWLLKLPERVDGNLREFDERFLPFEQKDIDNFVIQQHRTGEVDLDKE